VLIRGQTVARMIRYVAQENPREANSPIVSVPAGEKLGACRRRVEDRLDRGSAVIVCLCEPFVNRRRRGPRVASPFEREDGGECESPRDAVPHGQTMNGLRVKIRLRIAIRLDGMSRTTRISAQNDSS
jgi:hypothetical protein